MAEEKVDVLKSSWLPDPSEYPTQIYPKGISIERQWYLFESIRTFCLSFTIAVPQPVKKAIIVIDAQTSSEGGSSPWRLLFLEICLKNCFLLHCVPLYVCRLCINFQDLGARLLGMADLRILLLTLLSRFCD